MIKKLLKPTKHLCQILVARRLACSSVAALLIASAAQPSRPLLFAADAAPTSAVPVAQHASDASATAEAAITKALAYLKLQQQVDAGWQMKPNDPPSIGAIVLKGFVQDSHAADYKDVIDKALTKIASFEKPDGSVGETLITYNTAIVISAMAASNDPKYKQQLDKALAYLKNLQWGDKIQGVDSSRKVDSSDVKFGGWGYGPTGRADMSNVNFALDALKDAGLKSDDPAFQAAAKFASRAQNLSETNNQPWAGEDGGFIYVPGDSPRSAAGEVVGPDGKKHPRSYGAMSYAGLKSMMYAGLSKDDPRVKGAWKWIANNWPLDEHPGMKEADPKNADAGMFYYYHALARALRAYGEPIIVDAKGNKHDWRLELIAKLAATQQPDGRWIGTQRWMEDRPVLATGLAVLCLEEAQADLKEHPAK